MRFQKIYLEAQLIKSKDLRNKIIVTDGVFSMDGDIAPLPDIVRLAEEIGMEVPVNKYVSESITALESNL